MMLATEIRHIAHLYVMFILFNDNILLNDANFKPETCTLTYMFNMKGHEKHIYLIGDPHRYRERYKNPGFSLVQSKVTAASESAVDDRRVKRHGA